MRPILPARTTKTYRAQPWAQIRYSCSTTNNNNFANNDKSTPEQGQECECLVELHGAFLDEFEGTVTLVVEYMNFGSLAELLSIVTTVNYTIVIAIL